MTGQVGTEFTFFITVTDCASSNKIPSFNFAGISGLINGVPKPQSTDELGGVSAS